MGLISDPAVIEPSMFEDWQLVIVRCSYQIGIEVRNVSIPIIFQSLLIENTSGPVSWNSLVVGLLTAIPEQVVELR